MSDPRRLTGLKVTVSALALAALLLRLVFPNLRIDAVSLGFVALAILPWLSPLIKSAELPGGIKIEFQDVRAAAEQVTAGAPSGAAHIVTAPEPQYLTIAEQDPRLGLILLRIEIERRAREIAELAQIPSRGSLTNLMRELNSHAILSDQSYSGLRELVELGNRAAHGVPVATDAAYAAIDFGPRVLGVLDERLQSLRGAA